MQVEFTENLEFALVRVLYKRNDSAFPNDVFAESFLCIDLFFKFHFVSSFSVQVTKRECYLSI